jgi:hypothetical protein
VRAGEPRPSGIPTVLRREPNAPGRHLAEEADRRGHDPPRAAIDDRPVRLDVALKTLCYTESNVGSLFCVERYHACERKTSTPEQIDTRQPDQTVAKERDGTQDPFGDRCRRRISHRPKRPNAEKHAGNQQDDCDPVRVAQAVPIDARATEEGRDKGGRREQDAAVRSDLGEPDGLTVQSARYEFEGDLTRLFRSSTTNVGDLGIRARTLSGLGAPATGVKTESLHAAILWGRRRHRAGRRAERLGGCNATPARAHATPRSRVA